MRTGLNAKLGNWIVVGVLMVLISMVSISDVQAQVTPLNEDEIKWLTYMREEEKLARDVYLELSKMWGSRIFTNIAASEQTHMDAIKKLLVKYGIEDPALGDLGEFTNPALQNLYDILMERGSISLLEALKVGVDIEVTDIVDLEEGINTSTHKDIKTVYNKLLEGSLNHLDAFNSNLAKQ
jgi:hypothetical protein